MKNFFWISFVFIILKQEERRGETKMVSWDNLAEVTWEGHFNVVDFSPLMKYNALWLTFLYNLMVLRLSVEAKGYFVKQWG